MNTRSAIHEAGDAVAHLRHALLEGSLDGLKASIPALTDAARRLRSLESQGVADRHRVPAHQLLDLGRGLALVEHLIDNASEFHQGWARLLGAAAGYTSAGDGAPLEAAPRISVAG
jgi:hypothetical protein